MKKASIILFVFLLFSAVTIVESESPADVENVIYIRADGSVEPSTVTIERDGNVYKFTGDIQASIFVERDNVVIDGRGFILQGTGRDDYRPAIPEINYIDGKPDVFNIPDYDEGIIPESNNTGIYSYTHNLTIKNLKITEFWCAIELESSSDNCIIDNEIVNNTQGVRIYSSSNNTISGNNIKNTKQGITLTAAYSSIFANNITGSADYGIRLFWSFNNLSENTITNSGCGVSFSDSTRNVFRNNHFVENSHVFSMSGSQFQEYLQDVDRSNLVNGKPICYWIDKQDLVVPADAGWVALVNCTRIRVENLNLTGGQEIWLILTAHSTVTNNVLAENQMCIYLKEASNNNIRENTITEIYCAVQLEDSSNNYIRRNNITNGTIGIDLDSSPKNVIQQNTIARTNYGIKLYVSNCNNISWNTLTANIQGIHFGRGTSRRMNSDDEYNSTIIFSSSNNIVSKNTISGNDYGIYMKSTTNNTFYGNNFVNNTNQIEMDDSIGFLESYGIEQCDSKFASMNFWDNGTEGNYWSNYTSVDTDENGIGDTAHILDKNNQDNYPHTSPYETTKDSDGNHETSDLNLIALAVLIGLPILVLAVIYRRVKNT